MGAPFSDDELIYANDDLLFALDRALIFVRGFLNFSLHVSGFDAAQHAAERVNPGNVLLCARFDFIGQFLDGVGAAQRVRRIGDAGFVGDDLLRAQRQQRRIFRGRASASSMAFVCRDWQPPSTAAKA